MMAKKKEGSDFDNYKISDFKFRFNRDVLGARSKSTKGKIDKLDISKSNISTKAQLCFHISNFSTTLPGINLNNLSIKCLKNKFVGYEEWISRCSASTIEAGYFICIDLKLPEIKKAKDVKSLVQLTFEKALKECDGENKEKADEIILALRLISFFEVWIGDIIFNVSINNKYYNLYIFEKIQAGGSLGGGYHYRLKKNYLSTFKKSLNLVKKNKSFFDIKPLGTALFFFDSSYQNTPYYAKYINLIVVLESLWLFGSERGEQTHRICLRIAEILGGNIKTDKLKRYNQAKRLFEIRGKIVHGGFKKPTVTKEDIKIADLCILRLIAGESIKRYFTLLNSGIKSKEITNLIDESLLDKKKENHLYKIFKKQILFDDWVV